VTTPVHRSLRVLFPDPEGRHHLRLSMLNGFELSEEDEAVVLSGGAQRLIAFLALQGQPVSRDVIAETLWPEASNAQSRARLRTAIWRLGRLARNAVDIDVLELTLSPGVDLDFPDAQRLAHRLVFVDTIPSEGDMTSAALTVLSSDLLPNWYEDWAIIRQEEWRQIRLHALEALAHKFLEAGRYVEALEAATAARKVDPLRESPHALVIRVHLAEGNQSEAVREFLAFRQLLRTELGIEPTPELRDQMRCVGGP